MKIINENTIYKNGHTSRVKLYNTSLLRSQLTGPLRTIAIHLYRVNRLDGHILVYLILQVSGHHINPPGSGSRFVYFSIANSPH